MSSSKFSKNIFYLLLILITSNTWSQKITRQQYIDIYKKSAVDQMYKYKIPASITLAQGIIESSNGNSRLAVKGKNHFGIKCHGWEGKKIYADDDKKNECFRSYKNASESYTDHSLFLTKYDRYKFLFDYKITDYKSWAKGLKKAGYATSSKYADILIKVIEENKLFKYDKISFKNKDNELSISGKRSVYLHPNNIKYVWSKEDETFLDISKELDLGLWQLYKYNDVSKYNILKPGERVYIQPKRNKSKSTSVHTVEKGETLRSISQFYGIKTRKLKKRNKFIVDSSLKIGQEIKLR